MPNTNLLAEIALRAHDMMVKPGTTFAPLTRDYPDADVEEALSLLAGVRPDQYPADDIANRVADARETDRINKEAHFASALDKRNFR